MIKTVVIFVVLLLVAGILAVYLFPGTAYRLAMRGERAVAGLDTRLISIDGIDYSYTDGKRGAPLVLLHGFSAEKDHWNRVARHLKSRFRIIAPDLPGFGASTRDPALNYSIESQVRRLEAFVDRLALEQFHLGGSSMGGAIAAVYAARNPDRVVSLWLMAPAGVISGQRSEMEKILSSGEVHPLVPGNRQQFEYTLGFVFVNQPFLPAPVRRYLSKEATERQALRLQIFDDLLDDTGTGVRFPLNELVVDLAVPTLVVWGADDRVLHPAGAEKLRELLTNETVEIMPNMGHLPMLEAPGTTAERFLRFHGGL
ncbi:MAG: alpha/beta hydrolase [Gammaproteobacteria bacterium]|nr:alpha/beta hydrolase [Gammaproteobacteria bacterium]MDH3767800.1 alpha/beta hydrolase [Gammaproteobacteria bacterium]